MSNKNTEITSQLLEQLQELKKTKETEELEITEIKANPYETLMYIRQIEKEINPPKGSEKQLIIHIKEILSWDTTDHYKIDHLKNLF